MAAGFRGPGPAVRTITCAVISVHPQARLDALRAGAFAFRLCGAMRNSAGRHNQNHSRPLRRCEADPMTTKGKLTGRMGNRPTRIEGTETHSDSRALSTRPAEDNTGWDKADKVAFREGMDSLAAVIGGDRSAAALVAQVVGCQNLTKPGSTVGQMLARSAESMKAMAPQSSTEAMLAAQTIATHEAAMSFLRRAAISEHIPTIESCALQANRLMRTFNEQVELMQRLKGKAGQQKVTVEHVHVNAGGQAIVGTVVAAKTRGDGDEQEK